MKKHGVVQDVVIKTANPDGTNVVNVILKVSDDGQIADMFGVGENGQKWTVEKIKFTLKKKTVAPGADNDECRCCQHVPPPNGPIQCLPCPC